MRRIHFLKTTYWPIIAACVVFTVFVVLYESRVRELARSDMEEHARVISDDLWNYNAEGAKAYLNLVRKTEGYEHLVVFNDKGVVFLEVQAEPSGKMDRFFVSSGLIPRVRLSSEVFHENEFIGRIDVIWLCKTIYMYFYVLFALLLMVLVCQLYARILHAKQVLEARVNERTAELVGSNAALQQEITERRRVEEALRDNEEVFNAIGSAARDAIVMIDNQGEITYWSKAGEAILGRTREEMVGRNMHGMIAPERFRADHLRAFKEFKSTGRGPVIGETIEMVALHKDGREKPVELSLSAVQLRGQWHAVGIMRDITERKRAEKELRESEEKHRLLAENIDDVIWTMDMDMNLTYVSPVAEKMHGWSLEEVSELTVEDAMTPWSLEIAKSTITEQLALGNEIGHYENSKSFEVELYRADGSKIWAEVTASFILGDDDFPVGVLGVNRDISKRKNAQKEKEELQDKLARSKKMEALGLLAGGVAHDLNNVLSGIVSYPDLLLMDLPEESPWRKPIQTIQKSGQKAANIVQDLLTLARRGVTTRDVLNLNIIISDYLESPEHEKMLSYHPGVRVEADFEKGLPNIIGSPIHLKKTIMNLTSNAAEAQPGGGVIRISTRVRCLDLPVKGYERVAPGDYVVLRVEDKGEGIAERDLHRIFEPFYTKKVMGRSGTGLGMAVVWGTIQDHNGFIDVKSVPGEGAVFELYFPLTREEIRGKMSAVPVEDYKGKKETILVVDDIVEQREIAADILRNLNYTVTVASSGEEAVEYMKSHLADLVVLDMIMEPGIDGLETYERIVRVRPGQKAIITSGFAESDRVKEAQRLGAGAYIKKPYMMENIGLAVRNELYR
ncbi:MAG: PAS domain S-box protein [Desulfobacterales bacterium]|nr:PAS domain S-box protein [Desulfobacterales bacterium]